MRPTTLALAQPLNSSPALRLRCGANKSTSLAGLTEKSGGEGASVVANAPMSLVSPDTLRLAGMAVNAAQMGSQALRC